MSKPEIVLTPEQIDQLKTMAGLGLPVEHQAAILGVAKATLDRIIARQPGVKESLELGRGVSQYTARQRAYELAMGGVRMEIEIVDGEQKQKQVWYPPNERMLQFWLKTQAGFREVDRLELTGADGQPIKSVTELTVGQRKARVDELKKMMDETEDDAT